MRIIDLSLRLEATYRMHTPEGVRNLQLEFETLKDYPGGAGQYVSGVHMRLHNGTHVDGPMHFIKGGASVDAIPLDKFYGDATLVDLTTVAEGAPIRAEDLEGALRGRSIANTRVLLRTNFNRYYGQADYEERSPYISVEAVDWLCGQRPALVGYDYSHGKDDPAAPSRFYAVRTFLGHDIVTMGYLRNLDQIDAAKPIVLSALPLAFVGVESSPVRAVAVQPD